MIGDTDRRATLDHDFIKGHEYEVVVRATGPDGTQQPMESAARAIIQIQGKLDAPTAPEDLATEGYLNAITLTWTNPADYDVANIEVWRASTDDIGAASKIADVKGITYIDALGLPNMTRYYFVRAMNTSGVYSDFTESASGTSLGVTATDIDDFAVTATKTFLNTVVLTGDSWTNNSPGAGSIAWNQHNITWQGEYYVITAGNTSNRYVTFDGDQVPGSGSGTVADPFEAVYSGDAAWTAADNKFNIYVNEGGVAQSVWNSSANMVIGSAFILDAAITTAKINSLAVTNAKIANATIQNAKIVDVNAAKITAGIITGSTLRTAASGQRVIVQHSDNTLRFDTAAVVNVIVMDDNLSGSLPGIQMASSKGGIIQLGYSGVQTFLDPETLFINSNSVTQMIYCENLTHGGIFEVDYQGNVRGESYLVDAVEVIDNSRNIDNIVDMNLTGVYKMDGTTIINVDKDIINVVDINISGTYSMDGTVLIDTSKNLTNVGTYNGVNVASHKSRHTLAGADALSLVNVTGTKSDGDIIYWDSGGWTYTSLSGLVNTIITAYLNAAGIDDTLTDVDSFVFTITNGVITAKV